MQFGQRQPSRSGDQPGPRVHSASGEKVCPLRQHARAGRLDSGGMTHGSATAGHDTNKRSRWSDTRLGPSGGEPARTEVEGNVLKRSTPWFRRRFSRPAPRGHRASSESYLGERQFWAATYRRGGRAPSRVKRRDSRGCRRPAAAAAAGAAPSGSGEVRCSSPYRQLTPSATISSRIWAPSAMAASRKRARRRSILVAFAV